MQLLKIHSSPSEGFVCGQGAPSKPGEKPPLVAALLLFTGAPQPLASTWHKGAVHLQASLMQVQLSKMLEHGTD